MGVRLHNCKGITKGVGIPPLNWVECDKFCMVMSFTGSCRVKSANEYMVVISWDVTRHDQSEERNANRGSSAWYRFHSPSMGSSFPNAFSFIARSASRYMWVVSMLS